MENEKVSERNELYKASATAKRFSSTIIMLVSIAPAHNFKKPSDSHAFSRVGLRLQVLSSPMRIWLPPRLTIDRKLRRT